MKQKKIGDILYVFDTTPYVITQDTDAAAINIQNEAVQGFKLINNETVNAKIKGYNYFTMTVKKLEWADYADNYTITVTPTSNGTCTLDKYDADPGEEITITLTPAENYELDTLSVTAGGESVTVTNSKFTMPAADVTVTATFKSSAVTLSPTWYVDDGTETPISSPLVMDINNPTNYHIILKDTQHNMIIAYEEGGSSEAINGIPESSNPSVLSVDYGGSGISCSIWPESIGTATLTVTWAQQEVDGVMYAAGSASLPVTVTGQ